MLHQFSNHKEKKSNASPLPIISTTITSTAPLPIVSSAQTSASFDLEDEFRGLSLRASDCPSSSTEPHIDPSANFSCSFDSYFSRPQSPAVDSRHLVLPSSLPPRYSPSIASYIPSRGKQTGFITLKNSFYKELETESICPKHYLNSRDRERYRITMDNGFFYNSVGQLLGGPILYVLFPDNRLYGGYPDQVHHHTYVSQGIDVKAAGIAYFRSGQLITLSNESGHYKPTFAEMQPAMEWFLKNTGNKRFIYEDHSMQNPAEEFNGIHFFDVHPSQIADQITIVNAIENQSLPMILSELKSAAIEWYKNHFLPRYTEYSPDSSDFDDSYYDTDMITPPPSSSADDLALSAPQSILDCHDLQYLTCLHRIKGGKSSRFNGQLRLKRSF